MSSRTGAGGWGRGVARAGWGRRQVERWPHQLQVVAFCPWAPISVGNVHIYSEVSPWLVYTKLFTPKKVWLATAEKRSSTVSLKNNSQSSSQWTLLPLFFVFFLKKTDYFKLDERVASRWRFFGTFLSKWIWVFFCFF